MSIFNFFFKGKYPSKEAFDEEQSLNDLLRSMERQHYAEVPINFPNQVETAYDVIALMNNFKHIHHSLYVDKDGTQYYRTKLGFTSVEVYNKELENTKLRAELEQKEQAIKDLNKQSDRLRSRLSQLEAINEEQLNKLQDRKKDRKEKRENQPEIKNQELLQQLEAQKLEQLVQKKINALLLGRYSDITATKEATLVIDGLIKLDAYIKEKEEEHDHQQYKPGQKVDFSNQAEVRKRLLMAISFQNSLRMELAYVSASLSDLKLFVHDFLKKRS